MCWQITPLRKAVPLESHELLAYINLLSKCTGVEIHYFRSHIGITSFGVEIHSQNSGIQSQKSDSNHYFGVDFHSTALREYQDNDHSRAQALYRGYDFKTYWHISPSKYYSLQIMPIREVVS